MNGAMRHQGGHLDFDTTATRTMTAGDGTAASDIKNMNELQCNAPASGGFTINLPTAADLANEGMTGQWWTLLVQNDYDNNRFWASNNTFTLDCGSDVFLNGAEGATMVAKTEGTYRLMYYYMNSEHHFFTEMMGNVALKEVNNTHTTANALMRAYNGHDPAIWAGYSASNKVASVSSNGELTCSGGTMFTAGQGGKQYWHQQTVASTGTNQSFTVDSGAAKNLFILVDCDHSGYSVVLPAAEAGRVLTIKDAGGSEDFSITTPGNVTIDGGASKTVDVRLSALNLMSDGTNWWIF